MSQSYASALDTEWSTVSFNHEFLAALRGRNLEPEIEELYSVGTIRFGSEESSSYLLARVSHLTAPLDTVDVVDAQREETYICGCPGYYNHCYDQQIGAKIDDCKHCEKLKKQRKEQIDDEQSTLIP